MSTRTATLESLLQNFLTAKQVEGKSKATLAFYRDNLTRFLWWLHDNSRIQEVRRIEPLLLRSFLSYIQTTPNRWKVGSKSSERLPTIATVDAYWRTLQAFFSWLVCEEILKAEKNPMSKLPRPKLAKKVVQDIPLPLIKLALATWDENTFTGARNRAILLMLLDTGMRLLECSGLLSADVDLTNGQVKVLGKGNKERFVRIGRNTRQAIESYMIFRQDKPCPSLWLTKMGKPLREEVSRP